MARDLKTSRLATIYEGTAVDEGILEQGQARRRGRRSRALRLLCPLILLACLHFTIFNPSSTFFSSRQQQAVRVPINAEKTLARCRDLSRTPGPSPSFYSRSTSDRFVPGTKPTLLKNAKIWTGGANGTEVVEGGIFVDKGIIKSIAPGLGVKRLGKEMRELVKSGGIEIVDVDGAWVTPGIVDSHSHLGDYPAPALSGASDGNSHAGLTLPWLRSIDGLNTHDDSYPLSISGGITTALVLPGSANAIGGQAFAIKLRETKERSPTAMLLEPPADLNGTYRDTRAGEDWSGHWRQMKHACGENPSRVYSGTRMDTFWAFRKAYDTARQLKEKQDAFCSKALSGEWTDLGEFPDDLQWDALVDVLRGRVRVQAHCYEAVDLDDLIRLTNEFKFSLAAVHHAHEAYLVPEVLNKAYGHPPSVAIFAVNARYKREAFRGSEFAARILSDNGLTVVMKSDHAVLNSRYLLYEAQQAHYYGLADNLALSSVTTSAAKTIGMDHRIGYVREGYDADLVVWDSHPLALGATPAQVYIDGIAQLASPFTSHTKDSPTFQTVPEVPDFEEEIKKTIEFEGLPPLGPSEKLKSEGDVDEVVVFKGVKSVWMPGVGQNGEVEVQEMFSAKSVGREDSGSVIVQNGTVLCYGAPATCSRAVLSSPDVHVREVDLKGGSISPALISYGSQLGLQEISGEASTVDGAVLEPLRGNLPSVLGEGKDAVIRAVDGLQFETRDALLAYRSGTTRAITAPTSSSFTSGLSTLFSLGASHKLEDGAVIQEDVGLHVAVRHFGKAGPSVSTQIGVLRRGLVDGIDGKGIYVDVVNGKIPLVVEAHSADIIATLIALKAEIESKSSIWLQLTITGATEAHLLAKELGEAGVGVIFVPSRPFPKVWEMKRLLPGPPLSQDSEISLLVKNNVTVGIGCEGSWAARNARFDVGWAALEADGQISKSQALALASTNLEKLLGGDAIVKEGVRLPELVATEGGELTAFEGKVVAVVSGRTGRVDLF